MGLAALRYVAPVQRQFRRDNSLFPSWFHRPPAEPGAKRAPIGNVRGRSNCSNIAIF